jgi:hypothetical protein
LFQSFATARDKMKGLKDDAEPNGGDYRAQGG